MRHWKKYYFLEGVAGMKKRQQKKVLKRAGIKLSKGFPIAGLSTLEMRVCQRKSLSMMQIKLFHFNQKAVEEDLIIKDYLAGIRNIVRDCGSMERITGVKGSDSYARV